MWYRGVTGFLKGSYLVCKGGIDVLQGCYKGVKSMLQVCLICVKGVYMGVTGVLQRFYSGAANEFQGCFVGVTGAQNVILWQNIITYPLIRPNCV